MFEEVDAAVRTAKISGPENIRPRGNLSELRLGNRRHQGRCRPGAK